MRFSNSTGVFRLTRRGAVGMFAAAGFLVAGVPVGNAFEPGPSFKKALTDFAVEYCVDCHDSIMLEGGFDFDVLLDGEEPGRAFGRWVKVHDMLAAEEMPPKDKKQPDDKRAAEILARLAGELSEADQARQSREGRVQFRRLNRLEYENTLRDLLSLPRLEIKEMLPPDADAHGFDNVGSALRVSYVQMARYLDAAREALDEAAWLAPEFQHYRFRIPFTEIHRFKITKDRVTIGDEAVILRQPNTAQTPWRISDVQIPFPGEHAIRVRGRAATYSKTEDQKMEEGTLAAPVFPHVISIYQGTRLLGSIDMTAETQTREITAWLEPLEEILLYVSTMDDWNPKWTRGAYAGPAIALDWIEFDGPADIAWPRPSYTALFGDLPVAEWSEDSGVLPPDELGEPKHPKKAPKLEFPDRRTRHMVVSKNPVEDARRLLARFMERAFRRPVPEAEVGRYLALVKADLEKQKPFHEAMITGYTAMLASPDFLYFFEDPGRLDDHALANRLSYFLWRSLPDDTLRALADRGELQNDAALQAQVERMLADPKAGRFVEDFTDQWLELREIRATQPDEKLYPEFDDFLLESMVRETRAFFAEMLGENLPVKALVDTDFAFVNNALAGLYDLAGVDGVALRKVSLPTGTPRGGLLTHASVLKVTANGTTTSPVMRGAWVLDRLLGMPPPPPPPNVPAIEPDTRGAATVRELLKKHRADPACAGCHAKIDPPGFALESFDVIGGWRERYRALDNGDKTDATVDGQPVDYRLGPDVDPHGRTEAGRSFTGIRDFKRILLDDQRRLARNLVERLAVFATGAGVSFADRTTVERVLDETGENGYQTRDLLLAVVRSELFRRK